MKNKRAFTLIEMIVTIALILLLTTVFTSSLVTYITKSQSVSNKVDSHLSSYNDAKNSVDGLGNRGLVSPAAVTTYKITFKFMTNAGTPDEQVVPDILSGGSATPPTTTGYPGFAFDYWEGTYTNVISDHDVTAHYKAVTVPAQYNVTFTYRDSTGAAATPVTVQVTSGGNATPPITTGYPGYVFDYWEGTYTNVISTQTVNAHYKAITPYSSLTKSSDQNIRSWGGAYDYRSTLLFPASSKIQYLTVYIPAGAVLTGDNRILSITITGANTAVLEIKKNNGGAIVDVKYAGSVYSLVIIGVA